MTNPAGGPSFPGQAAVAEAPATPENTGAFLDQLAADAARASLPDGGEGSSHDMTTALSQPRAENGRFTAIEKPENATDDATQSEEDAVNASLGVEAPAGETATDEATDTTDGETAAVPAPALPLLTREPLTKFTVVAGETPVEGIPDLTITFPHNGKDRTEPLDKVVRLAIDGIYSEAREQKYRAVETEAQTARQQLAEYERAMNDAQAYVDSLLADEGRYLAEKDAWDRQNTPEVRAQRLQEQLVSERQQRQLEVIAAQGERYVNETLTPALDQIAAAFPFVSVEELVAKTSFKVRDLQGTNPAILPQQYGEMNQFILDDLAVWARQLHEHRASRFTPKEVAAAATKSATDAKAEAAKAVAKSQQTKSQVAKALKPVSGASISAPPKARPAPTNVDDAMEAATMDAVAAVLGR